MTEITDLTKKRVRSSNYTMEEKATLINIISKYKNIIESKKTDKVSWKDKSDTWGIITTEFNAVAPSGTYRTTDPLKKFYENMKKETRKITAQEKMELYKTGGGPAQKLLDPMHESVLTLMNTKTVNGFNNRFDSDRINIVHSCSDANNAFNNMTDSMIDNSNNNTMSNNNECDEDIEECYTYEVLNDDLETETTHDTHVNANPTALHNKNVQQNPKQICNWNTYTPDKLRASKHTALKVTKTNKGKENEKNILTETTVRQRRPSTIALHSSNISKKYSDLAEIKMELVNLQLIALKEEMVAKKKLNEVEFELKKKSLELDIELKQAQLKKLQATSFLQ